MPNINNIIRAVAVIWFLCHIGLYLYIKNLALFMKMPPKLLGYRKLPHLQYPVLVNNTHDLLRKDGWKNYNFEMPKAADYMIFHLPNHVKYIKKASPTFVVKLSGFRDFAWQHNVTLMIFDKSRFSCKQTCQFIPRMMRITLAIKYSEFNDEFFEALKKSRQFKLFFSYGKLEDSFEFNLIVDEVEVLVHLIYADDSNKNGDKNWLMHDLLQMYKWNQIENQTVFQYHN
uniref:Uncharacterized protein n=1 Tax=Panagrolaimus sp. JU765 TaxID=591449 RepID=A0AC34REB9_9BILA